MFKLIKIENGRINVPEPNVLTAGADITAGMALKLSSGKLVAATAAPEYISYADAANGEEVAVYRVTPDMVFEAPVSAAPTSLTPGVKVTLASGATGVTATTEGGVATVVDCNGAAAAGDHIIVRFA